MPFAISEFKEIYIFFLLNWNQIFWVHFTVSCLKYSAVPNSNNIFFHVDLSILILLIDYTTLDIRWTDFDWFPLLQIVF